MFVSYFKIFLNFSFISPHPSEKKSIFFFQTSKKSSLQTTENSISSFSIQSFLFEKSSQAPSVYFSAACLSFGHPVFCGYVYIFHIYQNTVQRKTNIYHFATNSSKKKMKSFLPVHEKSQTWFLFKKPSELTKKINHFL